MGIRKRQGEYSHFSLVKLAVPKAWIWAGGSCYRLVKRRKDLGR